MTIPVKNNSKKFYTYIFQWLVFFLEVIKPTLFSFIIFYLNCRILTWLARGQKLFTQNNKINVGFAVQQQQQQQRQEKVCHLHRN